WEVTTEEGGETKNYTLTITPNMLGTYTSADQEFAVTNVEQLEDRITFDISTAPNAPAASATNGEAPGENDAEKAPADASTDRVKKTRREFDGTLSNDLLEGDIYVDGRKVNTLTGKRKGSTVALTGFAAFAGTWELSVDSQI